MTDAKRIFDLIVGGAALCASSPFMLGVALAIKLSDRGPVFYRGERIGENGRPFRIFKFRSMVLDAEKHGVSSTSDQDQRITGPGKFIRKFKIDELPQLLNVIMGDMSLIGPRPEVRKFVDLYTEEEKEILSVKPGISDWASIWNRDEGGTIEKSGIADADEAYARIIRPTKIRLQLKYVRERTFVKDIGILLRTMLAVIDKNHKTSDLVPPPLGQQERDT